MDPWTTKAQTGGFKNRRMPRTRIPKSLVQQGSKTLHSLLERRRRAFARQLIRARTYGHVMGHRLFLTWDVKNPEEFVLTRSDLYPAKVGDQPLSYPLPRRGAKRLILAAVTLEAALRRIEADTDTMWERCDWVTKRVLREHRDEIRGRFQTSIQTALTMGWAGLHRDLRRLVFHTFSDPSTREIDERWKRVCRGSLSVTFVARALQGIRVGSKSKKAPKHKKWSVYYPTDKQDRWGKIDLIAVGRMRGLGEIILCIQIKTGYEYYARVMTQDPSETRRNPHPELDASEDALWEGLERFKRTLRSNAVTRCFPVMLQTGGAVEGVTSVAQNTKDLRPKIRKLLAKLRKELRAEKRREKMYRELDGPSLPVHKPRSTT